MAFVFIFKLKLTHVASYSLKWDAT